MRSQTAVAYRRFSPASASAMCAQQMTQCPRRTPPGARHLPFCSDPIHTHALAERADANLSTSPRRCVREAAPSMHCAAAAHRADCTAKSTATDAVTKVPCTACRGNCTAGCQRRVRGACASLRQTAHMEHAEQPPSAWPSASTEGASPRTERRRRRCSTRYSAACRRRPSTRPRPVPICLCRA